MPHGRDYEETSSNKTFVRLIYSHLGQMEMRTRPLFEPPGSLTTSRSRYDGGGFVLTPWFINCHLGRITKRTRPSPGSLTAARARCNEVSPRFEPPVHLLPFWSNYNEDTTLNQTTWFVDCHSVRIIMSGNLVFYHLVH